MQPDNDHRHARYNSAAELLADAVACAVAVLATLMIWVVLP